MKQLYLDYNATTPVAPSVYQAMQPFFTDHYGNPSSNHSLGRACFEAIEDARAQVADLLGAHADEVVFTSGGTESNNTALIGSLLRDGVGRPGHLIISALEHPAIVAPAEFLRSLGFSVTVVPSTTNGVVDPAAVEDAIRRETKLVSIMLANNEIGTLQPLREIANICQLREVLLHTDAAQAVGKIRTEVNELGVDMLSIAGHKLYAPKGVGALYVRSGVNLQPFMHGAGHESGLRAGTENVPYIVGLGQACDLISQGFDDEGDRLAELRDRLCGQLQNAMGEHLIVNGQAAPRLPNTLSVIFPQVQGHELLQRTPELCASTGSACHSGDHHFSSTLAALGLTPSQAQGTVRLSVGRYTTDEDVDRAANLLIEAWETLTHKRV